MFGIEPSPLLISLALVIAVAAVFFLPFLLLTGRRPLTGRGMIAVFVALRHRIHKMTLSKKGKPAAA